MRRGMLILNLFPRQLLIHLPHLRPLFRVLGVQGQLHKAVAQNNFAPVDRQLDANLCLLYTSDAADE